MFICNGRMCNDKGVGQFTSKDASVADYVIGSISFLKLVQNFSVLDYKIWFLSGASIKISKKAYIIVIYTKI
jgi:hypothetical protein